MTQGDCIEGDEVQNLLDHEYGGNLTVFRSFVWISILMFKSWHFLNYVYDLAKWSGQGKAWRAVDDLTKCNLGLNSKYGWFDTSQPVGSYKSLISWDLFSWISSPYCPWHNRPERVRLSSGLPWYYTVLPLGEYHGTGGLPWYYTVLPLGDYTPQHSRFFGS